ncbi:hypothetical protein [Acaricomes phytoseiuli]|uniref:hypothetical protein n=1 Tax=Acaricomes phytoseiuli TaxID=291968 RepID=UPI0003A18CCA|nr:hypothetical protein [Acaricomes phytoseiuli]
MAGKKKQKSQLLRRGGAAVAGLSLLVLGAFTAVAENAQATVDPANAVDLDQVPVQRDSEGRVIQVLPEEPLAAPVRGASPAKAAEAYAPGLAETFAAQGVGRIRRR